MELVLIRLLANMFDPVVLVAVLLLNIFIAKGKPRIIQSLAVGAFFSGVFGVILSMTVDTVIIKTISGALSGLAMGGLFKLFRR